MLAKYEFRRHHENSKVWFGRYLSPLNLPHWHEDAEILYCKEGEAEISVDDQVVYLQEGDACYVSSEQIHWVKSSKGAVLDTLIFDASILGKEGSSYCLENPLLKEATSLAPCIDQIIQEKKDKNPLYQERCASIVVDFVAETLRKHPYRIKEKTSKNDEHYLSLLEKIEKEYASITFEDAVEFMGFAAPYFSSYFKKKAGITFSQYLSIVRVEKAIPLIQKKEAKMSDIASLSGFNTIRHFNREFSKVTGYPPSQLPAGYSLSAWNKIRDLSAFDPTNKSSTLLDSTSN